MKRSTVTVRGLRLHYRKWGRGLPVLLLHGFPLSSELWEDVAVRLEDRCQVVAPDLRGHGDSDAPPGPYSMDALAEDVVGLVDALGLDRFVLGGHSMGGYVAFRVAARWPQRLLGLVLVATRAEPDTEEARARRRQGIERIRREGGQAFVQDFLPNLVGEHTRTHRPEVLARAWELARRVPDHVLVACLEGMMARPDSRPLLQSLDLPALVVAGEQDGVVPLASAQAMAEALARGRLVVAAGAGHLPTMEAPEVVASALADFLAALAA
ncbi:MAG: alpha/beta hydrolase [Armatimonadota bacterium]|nr:alpha/beta hydrolase [Armatimonadota bacterium]MDW8155917.1 alpha/beta hydrolase [Armatimonadota bacterium]